MLFCLDKFFLFGLSEGAAISLVYAATHTDKVKSVAVFGGTAKFTKADDYKSVPGDKVMAENMLSSCGSGNSGYYFCPQKMPEKKGFLAKLERMVCNPKTLQSILELLSKIDVRTTLPDINLPVLVLLSRDDATISKLNGRYLADNIPGAKYIEYPIGGHLPWYEERENIVKDLISFFSQTGSDLKPADRNLATILFTDIENSTKQMTEMGDKKWSERMNKHDEIMRNTIESFVKIKELNLNLDIKQSNVEGEIVNLIQNSVDKYDGIIINAAAYSHTSVAIRDALDVFKKPKIEVHISNIYKREEFRHKSLISGVVTGGIFGLGAEGYILAIISLQKTLQNEN